MYRYNNFDIHFKSELKKSKKQVFQKYLERFGIEIEDP